MKFTIVVVILALAIAAQGSAIPWAAHGYPGSHAYDSGAWDDGSWHGDAWGHSGDGSWGHHTDGISLSQGGHGGWGAHAHTAGISLSQGGHGGWGAHGHAAAVAVHAPVHGHGHDGHYVAKTLGAVHTAPLAGHIASVSSYNDASPPGTHY